MWKWIHRSLLIVALAFAPAWSHAQDGASGGNDGAGISKKQADKQQMKLAKDKKKIQAKEEKRRYKVHMQNQDKATRKRMKRNKRNADRNGSDPHRDPFLRRLFGSKH